MALAALDDGAVSAYRRAGALLYRATATGVQMQAGIPGMALAIALGRAVALPAEGAPQPAALVAVDPVAAAGMRAEIGRGLEAVRELTERRCWAASRRGSAAANRG